MYNFWCILHPEFTFTLPKLAHLLVPAHPTVCNEFTRVVINKYYVVGRRQTTLPLRNAVGWLTMY